MLKQKTKPAPISNTIVTETKQWGILNTFSSHTLEMHFPNEDHQIRAEG